MSEPKPVEPICPYCGKEMRECNDTIRSGTWYECRPCVVTVSKETAEANPFRRQWEYMYLDPPPELAGIRYTTSDPKRVERLPDAFVTRRRLVSEWEPDRG